MICIYCLEDQNQSSFTKIEHVLPQSFGRFKNNLTLHNSVCDGCNKYFGDNLEIALGRDTYEGGLRFDYGLRQPSEFKSLGKKTRLTVRIHEGEFKGAYAYREYSEVQQQIILKPVPQVGFRKLVDSEIEYYLLDQIPTKQYFDQNGYDLDQPGSIRILPSTEVESIQAVLLRKGFTFKAHKDVNPDESEPSLLCKIEGVIDESIIRAVAKIAFNYLAYWQGPEFMLEADFNPTREFIRYGVKSQYPLIKIRQESILCDESVSGKRRSGHLLTVDWAADKRSIVAQVSLLNWLTYSVSLARDFSGKHRAIQRGHFFDPYNQRILQLGAKPNLALQTNR
jgi:HNH endonuclease